MAGIIYKWNEFFALTLNASLWFPRSRWAEAFRKCPFAQSGLSLTAVSASSKAALTWPILRWVIERFPKTRWSVGSNPNASLYNSNALLNWLVL